MNTQNLPAISVITVVLNDREGLVSTAQNILPCVGSDLEWIILDGFSSDGTWEYVNQLNPKIGITLAQNPPRGIYPAMNQAANLANGKFLWFINAGDFIVNSLITPTLIDQIDHGHQFDIYANTVAIFTNSGYLYDLYSPRVLTNENGKTALFHHQGCLISREKFLAVGGFDENLRLASDGKLLDSIINNGTFQTYDHVITGFKMGGASTLNYENTLAEISTYRDEKLSVKKTRYLIFKTRVRLWLLNSGEIIILGKVVRIYFAFRQYRILKHKFFPNQTAKNRAYFTFSPLNLENFPWNA